MIEYLIVAILSAVLLGAAIGWKLSGLLFIQKVFDISNAHILLERSRPEEWNEIRLQNPNWKPDLSGHNLQGRNLVGVDLREAILDRIDFSNAILAGALLNQASLKSANLLGTSLNDANLSEADLTGTKLREATTDRASFDQVILDSEDEEIKISRSKDSKYESKSLIKLVHKHPELIDELTPQEFEELVAQVFTHLGYDSQLTPQTRDGGYDIILRGEDDFGENRILVEVKKYSKNNPVGASVLRGLAGVVLNSNANRGLLVTSSYVTKGAREVAEQFPQIEIVDRNSLVKLVEKAANKTINTGS